MQISNIFDDTLGTQESEPKAEAPGEFYSANIVPSSESEVTSVAEYHGVDVDYARDNFESLNYLASRRQMRDKVIDQPATLNLFDNVIDESWAADDYEQLGLIENTWRDMGQGWDVGASINAVGDMGWDAITGGMPDDYNERMAEHRAVLQRGRTGETNWASGIPGTLAETGRLMVPEIPDVLAWGAAGAATGAAIGSAAPGAGTAAGAATGGAWGLRVGSGIEMGKIEAGAAFDEYIQMVDNNGDPMDYNAARGAALLVGVVNGGLEMLSIERIARTIPGADKFLGKVTNKNLKALLNHPTMKSALGNFGARVGGAALGEGAIEALQEVITLGGSIVAGKFDGGEHDLPTLEDFGSAAGQAFYQGSQAGFGMGLPGSSIRAYRETKIAQDVAATQQAVEIINGAAGDITSLKGHKAKVQQQIDRIVELNEAGDTVYVDAEKLEVFFQEAGVTDEVLGAEMQGTLAALEEARANGGFVAVPISEYVANIAPAQNSSALLDDIKLDPDSYTKNEATALKEEMDAIEAKDEPESEIFTNIMGQLVEAGNAPEAAAQMAALWESTFEAMGDRLPITSQEFFEQFNLSIQHGPDAGPTVDGGLTLEQSDGFTQWSGGYDVIDPTDVNEMDFSDGRPYVLKAYHGTTHDFTEFDASRKGQQGGHFGAVNYFTTDFGDASENYAGEGPDLTNRIEQRTEQLENEDLTEYGYTAEDIESRGDEVLYEIARKELHGGEAKTLEVYIKTEKPFVVGEGDIYFSALERDMDAAAESIADSYGVTPGEALEQYEDEVWEEAYSLEESPLMDAIDTVAREMDASGQEIIASVMGQIEDGELKTTALEEILRSDENVSYVEDQETGELSGPHFIARVIQELGFDSIILKNAQDTFSSMDMGGNTAHVHVFDADNTNIKSVDNEGAFDPSNPNIYKQDARGYISMDPMREYFTITLTGKANLSTFLHESGHFFLEMMHSAALMDGADEGIKTDVATIRDWLGAKDGEALTRDQHELFARGFESYLMEGKAPNSKVAAAFDRFKGWLTRIYKTISSLNAPLTEEVRQVMDRMVGIEQGFNHLQGDFPPMFNTAEEAGMSDTEFAAYTDQYNKEMAAAEARLTHEVMSDLAKQQSKEYTARKKELHDEVGLELDDEQVYRARRFLSGQWGSDNPNFAHFPEYVFGHKLDTQSVKDMFGEVPPKLRSMVEPDSGLTADEIAPLLGYASGMEMLEELNSTPARGQAILDRVQSRLDSEFDDIVMDGKLEEESINAIHDGNLDTVITSELDVLAGKALKSSADQKRMAKYIAQRRVASLPILSLNRSRFLQAEKSSAKKAAAAVKEGDFVKALDYKTQQLVAHYMYKEAAVAQKRAEATKKHLSAFLKAPRQKAIAKAGATYLNAINALLDGVELSGRTNKELARRSNLKAFVESENDNGNDVSIPPELIDAANLTNYKQMSLSELESLRDTVDHLWATAKLKNQIKTKQGKKKLREVVSTLVESMKENAPGAKNTLEYKEVTSNKWKTLAASLVKPEFITKWIDGEVAGLAHSVLFQPLVDAQHKSYDMMKEYSDKLQAVLNTLDSSRMNADVKVHGETMSRQMAMSVLLNMGNEGNFKKMVAGHGWDRATLIRDLGKVLNADELKAAQEIWDLVDTLYPEIERISMESGQGRPPKVEASELSIGGVTLKGGYYPIVYDPRDAHKLKSDGQVVDSLFENNLFSPGVSAGFKEARVELKNPPAILLDLRVLDKHLGETIHFITHYEAVKQVEKVLNDTQFAGQFKDSFGKAYHDMMRKWLADIANKARPQEDFGFISRHLRIGMSIAAMGLNFGTAIMQGFGMFTTVDALGLGYTARGLQAAMNPSTYSDVSELSGEIRYITKNMDREIADTIDAGFGSFTGTAKAKRHWNDVKNFAFMHIAYAQRVVNVATFEGARLKALDEGMTPEQSVNYAEAQVRMTQSGAGMKDMAGIQRGGEFQKLITAFYTYFSVLYNRYKDAARAVRMAPKDMMTWVQFSQRYFWLTMAPVYVESLFRGDEPEEDESFLEWQAKAQLEYMTTTVPILRDVYRGVMSDYSPRPIPAADVLSDIAYSVGSAGKLIEGEELTIAQQSKIVNTFAKLGHVPTKTPWRIYEAMVDDTVEEPVRHMIMGGGRE